MVYSQVQKISKDFSGKLVLKYFLDQPYLKTKVCYLLWDLGVLKPRADHINVLPTKDASIVPIIKCYSNSVVTDRFNFVNHHRIKCLFLPA